MGGVLLVTVPYPVRTTNPPLGQLYLAASLRAAGIEVGLLDLASLHGPRDAATLSAAIADQRPEVLGFSLFTESALYGYELFEQVTPLEGVVTVAGGPHASARPAEPLSRGFDLAVVGEGESSIVELVQALRSGGDLGRVPGLARLDESGVLQKNLTRPPLPDLDAIPDPLTVLDICERDRYVPAGSPAPVQPAVLTSRGCPGRCTFCANYVSGRKYRFHSAERVVQEILGWQDVEDAQSFFFQDTSFTADARRLVDLCGRFQRLERPIHWVCKSRCDHLDRESARAMADAGCISVFFGMESGDPGILKRIKKGITLDDVETSLAAAREAGLRTHVHIMFGFPDETVRELDTTLAFMERIAPLVDGFTTHGILVPYPGTEIYESWNEQIGSTRWWLDRWRLDAMNVPLHVSVGEGSTMNQIVALHEAIEEGLLAARLVPYAQDVLEAIERCLQFRRDHNRFMLTPR